MSQKLIGLEYLQANEIKNMNCNVEFPYVFISYSHDNDDSQIVMNVFKALYKRGFNIWIDTANMPLNEDDWKVSATKALMNKNCKFAFFFRSESSMVKDTIAKELETIKRLKHIGPIVTIDIWHDSNNNAERFYDEILNSGNCDVYAVCDKICRFVNIECKALRLASDMGNDILKLVEEMEDVLKKNGVNAINIPIQKFKVCFLTDNHIINEECIESGGKIKEPEIPEKEGFLFAGWLNNSQLWNFEKDTVQVDMQLTASWNPIILPTEGYTYIIFNRKYHAEKKEQAKLMYDVFSALIERYPEKIELLTVCTSISHVNEVKNPNNANADPTYFRTCKEFETENQKYYVGTSYSLEGKIVQINQMLKIMGLPEDSFILSGYMKKVSKSSKTLKTSEEKFEYVIFGTAYEAGIREQSKLMYDVFDALIKRCPDKIELLTKCTSVSYIDDVTNPNDTKNANPPYFRACKKFIAGNQEYYVGTSYGLEGKVAQIRQMLKICGEDESAFIIVSQPEKKKRNQNDSKQSLDVENM